MDEKIIENLKSESRWLRLFYMILFCFLGYLAIHLLLLLIIVQAVCGFITSQPNKRLLILTCGLNEYFYQLLQYVTYNSENKPYPFSDWPAADSHVSDNDAPLNEDNARKP